MITRELEGQVVANRLPVNHSAQPIRVPQGPVRTNPQGNVHLVDSEFLASVFHQLQDLVCVL